MAVSIVLRDNARLVQAKVHKIMLNACQDMRWFTDPGQPHPVASLFSPLEGPIVPADEGLVVIDRDTRWMGGAQNYMALSQMFPVDDGDLVRLAEGFNLHEQLATVDHAHWPQVFALDIARARLLLDAYRVGAITKVSAVAWSEHEAWMSLSSLGLEDLPAAVDWLANQRRALMGDKCVMTRCAFGFEPSGWKISDYDKDDALRLSQELASRQLVPEMDVPQFEQWWSPAGS